MIFGPWGFRLFGLEELQRLDFINHLALSFIALSAGAELEWRVVRDRIWKIAGLTLFQATFVLAGFALAFPLIFNFGVISGIGPENALGASLLLGVIAIANSPSSAIAIINETRSKGVITQTVLSTSVIKDILVIALFAFTVSYVHLSAGGAGSSIGSPVGLAAGDIFGSILAETLFSMAVGIMIGIPVALYYRKFEKQQPIFIAGLAVFASELSVLLGLNELILCIVIGFIVRSYIETGKKFVETLEKSSMPIFVTFFAMAGAMLDLEAVALMWPGAALYFLLRLALLWISTRTAATLLRESETTKKHLWSGFTPQAGVSLGLATIIGVRIEGFGGTLTTLIVASIALNQLIGPILFKYSLQASGEAGKNVYNDEKDPR
jgi:Kef-type K+ transport system membrane component KefB